MQLSKRLTAVAALASDAKSLADIGTDHAYLPIYLVRFGKTKRAVAMDVNAGPLLRAEKNIRQYGLEEQIKTRLSNGLENLCPQEADTVTIAGMGGALTVRILAEGKEKLSGVRTLVLQPQSEIPLVRRFLHQNGWRITAEDMVEDDGKYYPMLRAQRGPQELWDEAEYQYGKYLIEKKNPCLAKFLNRGETSCRFILENLKERPGKAAGEGRMRAEKKLLLICAAKERMRI